MVEHKLLIVEQAMVLVQRLERLSADSSYAHKASGYRGALLKYLAFINNPGDGLSHDNKYPMERIDELLDAGYRILVLAARELS